MVLIRYVSVSYSDKVLWLANVLTALTGTLYNKSQEWLGNRESDSVRLFIIHSHIMPMLGKQHEKPKHRCVKTQGAKRWLIEGYIICKDEKLWYFRALHRSWHHVLVLLSR